MTPATEHHIRSNSSPSLPPSNDQKMQRANSTTTKLPIKPGDLSMRKIGLGNGNGGGGEERRHFDPSREPKLLGLL